jgi:hypothetical protein
LAAEVDAAAHDIDNKDQQTCAVHKISIEMYTFLLNWSPRSVEKVNVPDEDAPAAAPAKSWKGCGGKLTQPRAAAKNKASEWSWKDQVVPTLTLISKVLKLKTSKIWTVSYHYPLSMCMLGTKWLGARRPTSQRYKARSQTDATVVCGVSALHNFSFRLQIPEFY